MICTAAAILSAAAGFQRIPTGMQAAVKTSLLCDWATNTASVCPPAPTDGQWSAVQFGSSLRGCNLGGHPVGAVGIQFQFWYIVPEDWGVPPDTGILGDCVTLLIDLDVGTIWGVEARWICAGGQFSPWSAEKNGTIVLPPITNEAGVPLNTESGNELLLESL